ncbi:MAG: 4-hydroxythreonine-4-phosphate dehydrogenase PdxA [Flavobacteriales bacterium]|nr:4-hydroxythreonine-4-phosphate dehydrogenase PdxA [Flavobacteriaceae bacterium]MAV81081.1 4-hydroxythreonine-4-phosphate dehydrogenase PdxA [Flavobacteriales bacterium]
MHNSKPKVGISCGDPNGIGLEIILKSLKDPFTLDLVTPVIYCDFNIISSMNDFFKTNIELELLAKNQSPKPNKINVFHIDAQGFKIEFGKTTKKAGSIAFKSLKHTVDALKSGNVDFIVTAPINKKNIQSNEFNFPGHTDYLSSNFNGESLMFMITDKLKVGLLTDHIPLSEVTEKLTFDRILDKISCMHHSLKNDFCIPDPKIALLSINPHCGDDGVIGDDDQKILIPTVKKLLDLGFSVSGPFSADSFFGSGSFNHYHATMAVYHDQGLIPFKTISFGEGINYTAGLNIIRTSPDHGTAYNIAGNNTADHRSFSKSIHCALQIFKNRNKK